MARQGATERTRASVQRSLGWETPKNHATDDRKRQVELAMLKSVRAAVGVAGSKLHTGCWRRERPDDRI